MREIPKYINNLEIHNSCRPGFAIWYIIMYMVTSHKN